MATLTPAARNGITGVMPLRIPVVIGHRAEVRDR
jgi:hypothetical protein